MEMCCDYNRKLRQVADMPDLAQPDVELEIHFKPDLLPENPVDGIRKDETSSFQIVIAHEVAEKIDRFAATDTTKEVGGILLGNITADAGNLIIWIQAHIEARFTEARQGSVTFTHQSWNCMHEERERSYPDLSIVGWFHTHPGFGIFLSPHDVFIHRNFFDMLGQIAYVVDPKSHAKGFFRSDGDEIVQCKFHIGDKTMLSEYDFLRREYAKCSRGYQRARRTIKWLRWISFIGLILLSLSVYAMHSTIAVVNLQKKEYIEKISILQEKVKSFQISDEKIIYSPIPPKPSMKPSKPSAPVGTVSPKSE